MVNSLGKQRGIQDFVTEKKCFSSCSLPRFLPHLLFDLFTLSLDWCFLFFLSSYPHIFSKRSWRCPFPASPILCSVSSSSVGAHFNLLSPPFSLTLFYPFAFSHSTSLPCNLPLSAQKGNCKSIAHIAVVLAFKFYPHNNQLKTPLSQLEGRKSACKYFLHVVFEGSGTYRPLVPVHIQTHTQPGGTSK